MSLTEIFDLALAHCERQAKSRSLKLNERAEFRAYAHHLTALKKWTAEGILSISVPVRFPKVMGRELTRVEGMEGLRDGYKSMVTVAKQDDPSTVGFPDMETLLDHIEVHGVPPKNL